MRILKIGGRAQSDSALVGALAAAWKKEPGRMCVVHGGGDEISETQKRLGLEPKMHNGRRITTSDDLAVVRMVLSGLANKRLVSSLVSEGISAIGISGEDGGLLCAEPRNVALFGMVGNTPAVNPAVLLALLREDMLPVISPVSACSDRSLSEALNVNGDDAAAAIAIAMAAKELLYISDVPGVHESSGAPIRDMDTDHARELIEQGVAVGGMSAKIEAALAAIGGGVAVVRIGAVEMLANPEAGTHIRSGTGAVR